MMRRVLLAVHLLLAVLWLQPCLSNAQTSVQEAASGSEFRRYAQERFREAGALWQEKEFAKAVAILEELTAREELRALDDARRTALYNLACGYSLLGRGEEALAKLREAVEAGFADVGQVEKDTDLDNIRELPEFRVLVQRLRARALFWENPALNTPYRDDLGEEEKVAGLSKLWSEVKYNFAFFDRVPELSWDSLYVAYLPRVRQTRSTLEYYRLLQELTAHLHDGHTGVNLPPALYGATSYRPPIRTRLIEGLVLVASVDEQGLPDKRLRPGLEITGIDGIAPGDYAAQRVLPYVRSSTPQGREVWAYDYELLLGPKGQEVELALRDERGRTFTTRLSRSEPVMVRPSGLPEARLLGGQIAYVALKSFADYAMVASFDSLLGTLEKAEALVLDVRDNGGGNSSVGFALLGYLTDHPFRILPCATRDYRPASRALGLPEGRHEEALVEWPANGSRLYRGPVAVLTSARTGSAAEDFCAAFRLMNRGKLIGEATTGSTGQPLVFGLPGGGNATVCTAHCTWPDGAELVGVGIQPDIEVHPTVKDVRAGKDVVLEAAVGFLRGRRD